MGNYTRPTAFTFALGSNGQAYLIALVANGRSLFGYGFNGKERDTEGMGGGGSTYDYGFRIYNPRIGKFLSVDPLTKDYPWYTPYQFAGNTPIQAIDLDGLEPFLVNRDNGAITGVQSSGDNTHNGTPAAKILYRAPTTSSEHISIILGTAMAKDFRLGQEVENPRFKADESPVLGPINSAANTAGLAADIGESVAWGASERVLMSNTGRMYPVGATFAGSARLTPSTNALRLHVQNPIGEFGLAMDILPVGVDVAKMLFSEKDQSWSMKSFTPEQQDLMKDGVMVVPGLIHPGLGLAASFMDWYSTTPDGQKAAERGRQLRAERENGGPLLNYSSKPAVIK